LLKPDIHSAVQDRQFQQKLSHDVRCKDRQFSIGDSVFTKNFGRGPQWLPGVIDEIKGPVTYLVRLTDGQVVKWHVNHIRVRTSEQTNGSHDDLSFGPAANSEEAPLDQPQASHDASVIPQRTLTRVRWLPNRFRPEREECSNWLIDYV